MSYDDDFDDPPRGNGLGFLGNVGPKAAFFVVLIALSFMVGVVWKLYVGGSAPTGENVPIVRADTNPYKVVPDDPGGMDIPHKDSTIYSSLKDQDGNRVENLLADEDEEEPLPRSQLFAGLNTEEPAEGELEEGMAEDSQELQENMTEEAEAIVEEMIDEGVESVMPPPPEPILSGEIDDPEIEAVMDLEPPVTVDPEPEARVESNSQPVSMTSGDYYIQLASVKTRDGAEAEWKKIVAKYSSILSGYDHRVEAADLGDKGTFYRIQAGPVSKDQASATCDKIKAIDPNGCLVKKL